MLCTISYNYNFLFIVCVLLPTWAGILPFFIFPKIYLFERAKGRDREIFPLLVHPTDGHNGQC